MEPGTAPFKSRLGLNDLRRYCLLFLETDLQRRLTLATLTEGAASLDKAKVGNFFAQGSSKIVRLNVPSAQSNCRIVAHVRSESDATKRSHQKRMARQDELGLEDGASATAASDVR